LGSKERGEYGSGNNLSLQKNYLCADAKCPTEQGNYVGHDEPSLLFYSNTAGSGNSAIFTLVLPKDPPVLPKQNGTGGTFNFQLHPAFWFGWRCAVRPQDAFADFRNILASNPCSAPQVLLTLPGPPFKPINFGRKIVGSTTSKNPTSETRTTTRSRSLRWYPRPAMA
jgi:hypothetical protein